MKEPTLHITTEGGIHYQIGENKNNCIHYDFDKMLIYMEAKGKILFGNHFKIHEEDKNIIFKLCIYTIQDLDYCAKLGLDPNKGILLTGPVGCGKTSLMKLLRSKEHTSELQSRENLVCRLLLEKKTSLLTATENQMI